MNMPVMDGNTASLKIREYLYSLGLLQPMIVAITGHIEENFVNKALDDGINMVVSKPVSYSALKDVLKQCGYVSYDVYHSDY